MNKLKPCLVVLMGLPLTGKSTIAKAMAKQSNFIVCDLDKTRESKFGRIKPLSRDNEWNVLQSSYVENHKLALDYLKKDQPVVISATYSLPFEQKMLEELIKSVTVPVKIFFLFNSKNDTRERLRERIEKGNVSAVRSMETYQELESHSQQMKHLEVTKIDTGKSLDLCLAEIFQHLD